jgi:hypothetical protein
MQTLVIYPGRFHPFHRGHLASYQWLTKRFGEDSVFVATSAKQEPETSPFAFADKQMMMAKLGIPSGHVVQVKNPYQAQEITQNFDPEDTVLIFAISDKDAERISFKPKRDGSPAYLQPFPDNGKGMQPMSKHGYAILTPRVDFKVQGQDADSASQIRKLYVKSNDAGRDSILVDLYGDADANLRKIFDQRLLQSNEAVVNETVLINDPEAGVQLRPPGGMGTWDEPSLVRNLAAKITDLNRLLSTGQYRALYQVIYDRGALESMIKALADLEKFRERQGRRPIARGREIDISTDYLEEKWSDKYKSSINCSNPKGFSQKAHCAGRKKNESREESLRKLQQRLQEMKHRIKPK